MKKILLIFGVVLFFGSFSSCKKCTTCRIEKLNGSVEAEYQEYCGTPAEIDNFKKNLQEKSDLYLGSQGKVICVDK